MSTCLGFDPGTRYVAHAALTDGRLLSHGCIVGDEIKSKRNPGGKDWKRVLAGLVAQCEVLIMAAKPDVIACEATQQNLSSKLSAKSAASNYANTVRTQELVGHLRALAERHGAAFVTIHPTASLSALGCRQGAKDRDVVEAFARLTGEKLLVGAHHEARAWAVAKRGPTEARLDQARREAT